MSKVIFLFSQETPQNTKKMKLDETKL